MKRVVVTRASDQAGSLVERITAMGWQPVVVPLIAMVGPEDGGASLRSALNDAAQRYDWIAVTSPNGAVAIDGALNGPLGSAISVAAVGPGTAAALTGLGHTVAFIPDRSIAEGLLESFASMSPGRILLPQAADARTVLADGLTAMGWEVTAVVAYRSVPVKPSAADVAAATRAHAIVFTSSSTVNAWVATGAPVPSIVVSIGPATSDTARRAGITVTTEAAPHTLDGVISALATALDQ